MKNIRLLAEERLRVEEAVAGLTSIGTDPRSQYLALEEISIQVLDTSFDSYPEGVLAAYLQSYLYMRQLEYGLIAFTNPLES
jgi:hypothetical protein